MKESVEDVRRVVVVIILLMWGFAGLRAQRLTFNTNVIRKLQMAEGAINNLYVDTVDEDKLVEDAIRGMLRGLDPHSSYTTAKETESLTEPLEGSFEGIGVEFNMSGDTLLVIQTVAGGPSEKAGILAGDRIVSVNDTTIAGVKMRREEIMRRLRGKKGTTARLGIVRRGIAGELVFDVKRDRIPVTTVDAAYMLTPQIGYIRIGSFGMTTYDEFIRSVDSLRFRGMRDLVIDLQENGGGYLQSAVKIANEFLQNNDLIVYTEGRRSPRQEFRADGRGKLLDGRVAVLVNEYTASAAEILSGAIQDEDRGVIIGRRTFGKGLVQKPIEFGDGSMLRLTVSHYYTPSGRCIQKPYEKGDAEDYGMDLENRLRRGELYSADSINFADSLLYTTLRRGRPVYGGGGIMPDEFVPLDTAQLTYYHRQLAARGLVIGASLRYVDGNRKALKAEYAGADDFIARFETPESVVRGIFEEADTMGIKPRDADEQQATIPMLSLQLKALAARDLWDMTAYFRILNTASKAVERAVAILEEEEKE